MDRQGAMSGRSYTVSARTTDVAGRVLASCRNHHWIIDSPTVGDELTPAEFFLGAVAGCAAELVQRLADEDGVPLDGVRAHISGTIPAERIRDDVSIFARVRLDIEMLGPNREQGAALVEAFKGR
jgi:uncharacterized OsmC-like protein